jgi:3-isopropylmalate/(R)-2-methylmalate dehydratase large subunit
MHTPTDTRRHAAGFALTGRVLYLLDDAALMQDQLAGATVSDPPLERLRDNVSTDEITPTTVMLHYDSRLGGFPYVGLRCGDTTPIPRDSIRLGGFQVTVAGSRYGKGSSRESSPMAELSAGIRLVIARSFERIYRQNAHNLGLLTSTDFGLLPRLHAGETIPIEEFLQGHDRLTQQIILAGGLLAFSRAAGLQGQSGQSASPVRESTAGRSLALKIFERAIVPVPAAGPAQGAPAEGAAEGVFVRADWRFSHEYFTGMAAHLMHAAFGDPAKLTRPDTIVAFQDHLTYAAVSEPHRRLNLMDGIRNLTQGHHDFVAKYGVKQHGELPGALGSEGICHALMTERYAMPGQLVVGTDSHTPHSGSIGALAFGVGATDMANAWVTGLVRTAVPRVCKVQLEGRLRDGVAAKDVVLELLRLPFIAAGRAIGMVLEYSGPVVRAMSIDDRATLTNMVAEMGGLTGIVPPDDKTVQFLRDRRGIDFVIPDWMHSDEGAHYEHLITLDCSALEPMFARPGDPGNGIGFSAIAESVPIDIAYGGSCTAGKWDDFVEYHRVLEWGVQHGLRVHDRVSLFLQFGTEAVRARCASHPDMLNTFDKVGARLLMPGCGSCANCGPGASTSSAQVTVSAINRNFPGRSGPGQVWLASPASVAASALAGELCTFDALKRRHSARQPNNYGDQAR